MRTVRTQICSPNPHRKNTLEGAAMNAAEALETARVGGVEAANRRRRAANGSIRPNGDNSLRVDAYWTSGVDVTLPLQIATANVASGRVTGRRLARSGGQCSAQSGHRSRRRQNIAKGGMRSVESATRDGSSAQTAVIPHQSAERVKSRRASDLHKLRRSIRASRPSVRGNSCGASVCRSQYCMTFARRPLH